VYSNIYQQQQIKPKITRDFTNVELRTMNFLLTKV